LHNFPSDFPAPEAAIGLMQMMFAHEKVFSVVAEVDGTVAGSNFLWEGNQISGVGPITVNPQLQKASIGRNLMERVIRRSEERGFPAVRLVQAAYNNCSLSLYTKLGFDACEPLSLVQGNPLYQKIEGCTVRPATTADVAACDQLCLKIHGHTRTQDLIEGIAQGTARVVEHDGEITGYTSSLGIFGYSLGQSNEDLKALIGAAEAFQPSGFLLPTRNGELLRWCLKNGLRIVEPMTLMSRGLYQEPRGKFLPSILY
jgi:GNAT superfamily N-acetyltransferase